MKKLILGIPAGSLQESSIKILEKMGLRIMINGRNFIAEIEGSELFVKAIIMRPNDLPFALASGVVDAIITGRDMLMESRLADSLHVIRELNFSKKSRTPTRVIVFCRQNDSDEIEDSDEINVSSEFQQLAIKIFSKANVVFSSGSTEIKVADARFGFRYGVGVTETGKSLADNGLKIVKTIMISPVVFVARKKTEEFEIFGKLLEGVLLAENYQLVKFNISTENVADLVKNIPSLQAPTISNLSNGMIAIETVVAKDKLVDTLITIKKREGRGILVQNISVMT